jgi:integrase
VTARRSRGDGSVFRDDARKVWVASVSFRDPGTGRRTRRKASAPTKTAALGLLGDMKAEIRKAGTVGRADLTVGAMVAAYLAHPPAAWRSPITVQVNRDHAARITTALGKLKLRALTATHVERFLAGLAAEKYSAKTIADTARLLRSAIRRAQRDGQVGQNVCDLIEERPGGTVRPPRWFTMDQVQALLAAAADDPWWHAYVSVAVMCGLRPGELLGLRWSDLDLAGKNTAVRVRYSLGADGLDELKTKSSRRTLGPLPAAVTAALRAHKRDQAQRRLRLGAAWREQDLVFGGPDGSPLSKSSAGHGFRALCERAGLGTGWTRYATRHTICSVLSDGGTDIEVIADAMGHVNSNVTRSVYRHAMADQISAAAGAFDKIMPAAGP